MEQQPFRLEADYAPAGDQPQAIEKLVEGLNEGLAHQTLLGVTGSGKTFSVAGRDRARAAPDDGARPQQDPRRTALRRVSRVLPAQRGRVLRLLLRLLPAGSLRAVLRHLYREGRLGERAHRADAALGHQGAARAARLDHRRDRLLDLRPGRPAGISRDGAASDARRAARSAQAAAAPGGHAVHAQRARPDPGHLPRARRCHRHLPSRVRARGGAGRALRRAHRFDHAVRSAHRGSLAQGAALHGVPGHPLCDAARAAGAGGRSDPRRPGRAPEGAA